MKTLQERFHEYYHYDADTGLLYLRNSVSGYRQGHPVGSLDRKHGRLRTSYKNKHMLVHRIVWCMAYGEPIPKLIDHIDRDASNNRLNNLRAVTHSVNLLNTHNTENIGVTRHQGGWRMQIGFYREHFKTEVEARQRRKQLLQERGVI